MDGVTAQTDSDYGDGDLEVQAPAGHRVSITLRIERGYTANNVVFKPMYRKPDTSPDFEPYQIGVGQRTGNLFNATIEQGGLNSGSEYGSSTRIRTTFMPNMLDAGTYTVNASGLSNVVINYFDDNKTYTGGVTTWRTLPFTFNISNRCYVRFAFRASDSHNVTPSDISNIMLVEGSTAPQTFIPYGYEVPLDIRHKTKNLLKDEWRQGNAQDPTTTVRCGATSVIPTVLGDTFSFGLYNATKRYAIYGINAAGLAEFNQTQTVSVSNRIYNPGFTTDNKTVTTEDENIVAYWVMLAQTEGTIPATIVPDDCKNSIVIVRGTDLPSSYEPYYLTNHEDIYIGDSPLTEGQTVSNTQDIEVFEGENTIDTTLYNKPVMEIEYE